MGVDSAMRHRAPLSERGNDLYETPPVATHALLDVLQDVGEPIKGPVWEPCCGKGAISRVLESRGLDVISTDLVDYGFGRAGRDFLMESFLPVGVTAIVTNPPYKLASECAAHAIRLAPRVFMLLRLAFLEAGDATAANLARRERAFALDGGRLARVIVFANRLPMMHRDGWDGNKVSSGAAFAWFCWDREHQGPATLHRVFWRERQSPLSAAEGGKAGPRPPVREGAQTKMRVAGAKRIATQARNST